MSKVAASKKTGKGKASSSQTEAEKLQAVYKNESPLHKRILQIKSLLYYVKGKSEFSNGITRSTLLSKENKKLYPQHLNPILDYLRGKKLLQEDFNCHPEILHILSAEAVLPENVNANLEVLKCFFSAIEHYDPKLEDVLKNCRAIHLAVHLNHTEPFLNADNVQPKNCHVLMYDLIEVFYTHSLDPLWVKSRHHIIQLYLLCTKLYSFYANINFFPPDLIQWTRFIQENDCVEMAWKCNLDRIPLFMSRLLQISLSFRKLSYLQQQRLGLLDQSYYRYEVEGALAFFDGDKNRAIQHYEKANKLFKSLYDKHEWFRCNIHGIFYVLALLSQEPSSDDLKKAAAAISSLRKIQMHEAVPHILEALLQLKRHHRSIAIDHYNYIQYEMEKSTTTFPLLQALIAWVTLLLEPKKSLQFLNGYQREFRFFYDISHYITRSE